MPSSVLKYIGPAMLLASAVWASEVSAISVPYHPYSKDAKGLVNYPPLPEKPFASTLHPTEKQQAEVLHRLKDKEHDHYLWSAQSNHGNRHNTRGNGHTTHGDQNDGSEVNTSVTLIPPVSPSYPQVTPSTSAVPIPAALWLFLSGIIGLGVTVKSHHR